MVVVLLEWRPLDFTGAWKCCVGMGLLLSAIISIIILSASCTLYCSWLTVRVLALLADAPNPPVTHDLISRPGGDEAVFRDMVGRCIVGVEMHAATVTAETMAALQIIRSRTEMFALQQTNTESPAVPETAEDDAGTILRSVAMQQALTARDDALRSWSAKYTAPQRYFSCSSSSSDSKFKPYRDTSMLAECQKEFCAGRPGRSCRKIGLWSYGASGPVFCRSCAQKK